MPGFWVHPPCACGQSLYCVLGVRRRRKGRAQTRKGACPTLHFQVCHINNHSSTSPFPPFLPSLPPPQTLACSQAPAATTRTHEGKDHKQAELQARRLIEKHLAASWPDFPRRPPTAPAPPRRTEGTWTRAVLVVGTEEGGGRKNRVHGEDRSSKQARII